MNEQLNYISDTELEQLILQVEQEELVAAPPDLMENILVAVGKTKKKEFSSYCFRVITSVAAAIALVFLLPELTGQLEQYPFTHEQEVPSYEEVVEKVPSKEDVVASKPTPTKEEVLNNTGLIERVLNNTGWFNKSDNEK